MTAREEGGSRGQKTTKKTRLVGGSGWANSRPAAEGRTGWSPAPGRVGGPEGEQGSDAVLYSY